MKFVIITHAIHKIRENKFYAYGPYVREMNLWLKNVSYTKIIAPISAKPLSEIDTPYNVDAIGIDPISSFNLLSLKNKVLTILKMPLIFIKIFRGCLWADHIHLRCPGNIGLIGCVAQVFFPFKPKTVKYAGNWDPNSKQPLSYRFQKWLLSNTFFSKNIEVLVYGDWQKQSKNIIPFFTASYSEEEIEKVEEKTINNNIKFIYVGTLTENKRPFLAINAIEKLIEKGVEVCLDIFGDGIQYDEIDRYIKKNGLISYIHLHGNQSKETVKKAFQKSNFLLFFSKSEGWPKVVAEAMFWGCVPITTSVSCVPFMLDFGKRGALAKPTVQDIFDAVETYLVDEKLYKMTSKNAVSWSREYTLEKFEKEIEKLVKN